jgi:hypothetical protein
MLLYYARLNNTVGENLVAMAMPEGAEGDISSRKRVGRKRASATKGGRKAATRGRRKA